MVSSIKLKIISVAEFIHIKIFRQEMGIEMRKFLTNLGTTMISTVFTGTVMLVVNILAGRFMGPEEYGKYQLSYSMANILIIFMLLGINISVARINFSIENKYKTIGTSFWFVIGSSTAMTFLVYYFRLFFLKFNISNEVVIFSIFLSISLALYNLIKSYFQAEQKFRLIAKYEIINYIIVAASFFSLLLMKRKGFEYIIYPLILGYSAYSIIGIYKIKSYLFNFDLGVLKGIMRYGFFAFLIISSGILISSFDRIILNLFLGEKDLGIYSAYFLSSTVLVMFIVKIFSLVFFPTVSKINDVRHLSSIVKKIKKLEKHLIIPIFFVNFIAIYIFMKLYGSKYDFRLIYLFLISMASTFSLFTYIRQWFLAGAGDKGIRISLKIVVIVAILSVIYYIFLVKAFDLLGAFWALFLVNVTFYILNNHYTQKNYVINEIN